MTAAKQQATKVGRGSTTSYKPSYCDDVIRWGKEGKSIAAMCSKFEITRSTITKWSAAYPEFNEALERSKIHSQEWWERVGQEAVYLGSKQFNGNVWISTMRARFPEDYSDRREVHTTGSLTHQVAISDLTDEDLAAIATGSSAGITG